MKAATFHAHVERLDGRHCDCLQAVERARTRAFLARLAGVGALVVIVGVLGLAAFRRAGPIPLAALAVAVVTQARIALRYARGR